MPAKERQVTFKVVTASGSHHQIGVTVGKACREQALRMEKRFRKYVASVPGGGVERALAHARKTLPLAREYYPQHVEELEGYAEGTGLDFEMVYAMNCDYPWDGGKKACTDIAVNSQWTKDDCVYAAHNEDVSPYMIDDVVISRIRPNDEPAFIAMCYGGIFPTEGMNSEGISLTGNALVPNDTRLGLPKSFPVRKVLRETNIYSAIKSSMPEGRGHSFNNIVCDPNGEIYSMEGSATTFDALYAEDGWLVHTNHYLSPRMWQFESNMHTRFSSIVRYNRARRLLRKELGQVDLSTFKKILSDHVGYPESICRHPDPALSEDDQARSIFSIVCDLTRRVMWVCAGNPCEGQYQRYEI